MYYIQNKHTVHKKSTKQNCTKAEKWVKRHPNQTATFWYFFGYFFTPYEFWLFWLFLLLILFDLCGHFEYNLYLMTIFGGGSPLSTKTQRMMICALIVKQFLLIYIYTINMHIYCQNVYTFIFTQFDTFILKQFK